ncbi:hypothetical protein C2S51_014670 [Perilla frutescens var. frutescens]|nr:hypothetical protein C2S51_014670 [Perilla frutescens var. frutescens]
MAINEPADDDPAAEIQPDDLPPADDQIQPAADLPPDQPAHDDQDLPWHWVLVEERLFGVTPLGMVQHVLNQEAVYGFNEDGGDVFDLFYLTDNDENGNVDALIPDDYPVRTVECLTLLGSTLMNLREMVKNRSQIVFQIFENLMIIVGHNQETVTYLRQQDYLILTRVEEIIGFLYMVNKCGFTGAAWVLNRETEKSIEEHLPLHLAWLLWFFGNSSGSKQIEYEYWTWIGRLTSAMSTETVCGCGEKRIASVQYLRLAIFEKYVKSWVVLAAPFKVFGFGSSRMSHRAGIGSI